MSPLFYRRRGEGVQTRLDPTRTDPGAHSSRRQGAVTLNDMKDMLASLPQYQEMREKVRPTWIPLTRSIVSRLTFVAVFRVQTSSRCISAWHRAVWTSLRPRSSAIPEWSSRSAQTFYRALNLRRPVALASLLQNCATGVTPEGRTPKSLVDDMVPLLGNNETVVSSVFGPPSPRHPFVFCLLSLRLIALLVDNPVASTKSGSLLSISSTRTESPTRTGDDFSSTRSSRSRSRTPSIISCISV